MRDSIFIHPYNFAPDSHKDVEVRILLTKEDVVSMYRILSFYNEVTQNGHRGLDDMIIHEEDREKGFAWLQALSEQLTYINRKKEALHPKEQK